MIDPAKKYRTMDGKEVRIYATDAGGSTPVHGAIRNYEVWNTGAWSVNGKWYPLGPETASDLIEVKPPREGWINVSRFNGSIHCLVTQTYASRGNADANTVNRLACIHIRITDDGKVETLEVV